MRLVGAHLPVGKGFGACVRMAHGHGMNALQVFTSSPRMWRGGPADPVKTALLKEAVEETGLRALVTHDTYLVNLVAADPEIAAKSYACLRDELERSAAYGIPLVVSHLGAAVGRERGEARRKLGEVVAQLLEATPNGATLLAETTAGQGSVLNATFEEIADLIAATGGHPRFGVCLDTCHVHAAGYDLSAEGALGRTLDEFDRIVGLDRLRVVHVNDSVHPAGSRKDRHAALGEGTIGPGAFRDLMRDDRLKDIPLILETPMEGDGHLKDLAKLRDWE